MTRRDDIELATKGKDSMDVQRTSPSSTYGDISHYTLAKQMINYQSIDVGAGDANCKSRGSIILDGS